jgi:sigma-B regulation protein RsbU (phosphoserine phosphatase)
VPGYDLAGASEPCRSVGADYYDFFWDGRVLHLALGDVAGKGVAASIVVAALRAAVRAHWLGGRPAEATASVNSTFFQCVPADRYATFFLGRLDSQEGQLTYVNAGHNRPLLVRGAGGVDTLASAGTILGAFDSVAYGEAAVPLAPEDTLLVFSDGISDAWPRPDDAVRALADVVRSSRMLPAGDLAARILGEVERQNRPASRDDRTLIVLKRAAA